MLAAFFSRRLDLVPSVKQCKLRPATSSAGKYRGNILRLWEVENCFFMSSCVNSNILNHATHFWRHKYSTLLSQNAYGPQGNLGHQSGRVYVAVDIWVIFCYQSIKCNCNIENEEYYSSNVYFSYWFAKPSQFHKLSVSWQVFVKSDKPSDFRSVSIYQRGSWIVLVEDGFTVKLCNNHCLFTVKTILIGYHPQNYVNKQWVLHSCHHESTLNKYDHCNSQLRSFTVNLH